MADPQPSTGGQSDLPATVADEGLRASHADRDQVAEVLRVAAGDGRLSPEELDERPPAERSPTRISRRST